MSAHDHGAADLNAAQRALDDLARERAAKRDDLRAQLAAVTAERDALHAAVRTLAAAQLTCDAAGGSYARAEADAALDNASVALFALVPAEVPA